MQFDFATIAGLIIGVTVVGLAILSGSDIQIFFNLPGFLIVFGGTFAATLIKFPLAGIFFSIPIGIRAAFTVQKEKPRDYIRQAIQLVKRARKNGIQTLEKNNLKNPFFKKGGRSVG